MDLRLPDMDGTDAARMLAERGADSVDSRRRVDRGNPRGRPAWLRTAGFAGYLEKPIDVERFPDQVRRYCR